jgi:hypothetical protein
LGGEFTLLGSNRSAPEAISNRGLAIYVDSFFSPKVCLLGKTIGTGWEDRWYPDDIYIIRGRFYLRKMGLNTKLKQYKEQHIYQYKDITIHTK